MSGVTVFFKVGKERAFDDTIDCIYKTEVADGHLHVSETRRLIPGTEGGFKSARTITIYPPGQWREVEFDYDNPPVYEE